MNKDLLSIKEAAKDRASSKVKRLDEEVELFCSTVEELISDMEIRFGVCKEGREYAKASIKRIGFEYCIEGLYTAFNQYYDGTVDGATNAFNKSFGIAYNLKNGSEFIQSINYIIGICRNRFTANCESKLLKIYLEENIRSEEDVRNVISMAKESKDWLHFTDSCDLYFDASIKDVKKANRFKLKNC